jgi:anti-sigma factor RsiW
MSVNDTCNNLDAYLADDLPGSERAAFESHLDVCPACHDAVDEQQWIEDLLQSPARLQFEWPPALVLDSLRASVTRRRRRVVQAACGLAAAAVLLIAVGLSLNGNHETAQPVDRVTNTIASVEPTQVPTAQESATTTRQPATFVSTSEAIAVPVESSSSDVTIVQVYPTTDTERRWRLKLALSTNSVETN